MFIIITIVLLIAILFSFIIDYMAMRISTTPVHTIPKDVKMALLGDTTMRTAWNDITPLARNEFVCWIISAKKPETRARRIQIARDKLTRGERRPCCWAGCPHREKTGR